MTKKVSVMLAVVLITLFVFSCAAHIHTVGNGPQKNEIQKTRQWYILWGLVNLNEVDTKAMAGDATDYEIKTEISPLDFLIGIPASCITVRSRTVTVTK